MEENKRTIEIEKTDAVAGLNERLVMLNKAMQIAESLKAYHLVVEDCWYSCPASGKCCNDNEGDRCNCGADTQNKKVSELVALLSKLGA